MSLNVIAENNRLRPNHHGDTYYSIHAPAQNPTQVRLVEGGWKRTSILIEDPRKVEVHITGVTVKLLLDKLIEDPEIRSYLASGVDYFRSKENAA